MLITRQPVRFTAESSPFQQVYSKTTHQRGPRIPVALCDMHDVYVRYVYVRYVYVRYVCRRDTCMYPPQHSVCDVCIGDECVGEG